MIRKALISVLIVCVSAWALGQTKEDLQRQKQKAFEEIKLARELMEKTTRERVGSTQQLRLLQRGIQARARLISTLEKEVAALDREIAVTTGEIDKLEKEQQRNRDEYARLIYYAYRNHTNYEKLMYILAGESISQSYQRYKYLKYITDYREEKSRQIIETVENLKEKEEELGILREEKLGLMEEKDLEQSNLRVERNKRSEIVEGLRKQEATLKKEIEEKERIARELEARIREIIEEEARRSSAGNVYAALTPEQQLVGKDFRKNKGKLPWPVDKGIVTIGYGDYEVEGLRGSSVKNMGIDINSAPGTDVRSIFDGEVTKVMAIVGNNYTVLVRHGEYLTVYNNIVNVRVKSGDKVLTKESIGKAFVHQGDNIATMHFQVWHEKTNLNPEEWLSK